MAKFASVRQPKYATNRDCPAIGARKGRIHASSQRTSWNDLPCDVLEHIASFLSPNQVAGTFRLINKSAAKQFRDRRDILMSQPVPHHTFVWRWGGPAGELHLTLVQRRELLCLTARSGSLANLQVAFAAVACPPVSAVFLAAASAGHRAICKWLSDKRVPFKMEAVRMAAKAGRLEVVRWMLRNASSLLVCDKASSPGVPAVKNSIAEAAWAGAGEGGQRAVCELLLAEGLPLCKDAVFVAATHGHADLTEWLLKQPKLQLTPECEGKLLVAAAQGLDQAALRALHDSRLGGASSGYSRQVLDLAALAALLSPTPDWRSKLEWVETKGPRRNPPKVPWVKLFERVDAVARLEVLRKQAPLTSLGPDFTAAASCHASLEVLRYLSKHGMGSVLEPAFIKAAERGDLAVLGGLAELGCGAGEEAAMAAAKAGKLHVVRWLLEEAPAPAQKRAAAAAPEAGGGGREAAAAAAAAAPEAGGGGPHVLAAAAAPEAGGGGEDAATAPAAAAPEADGGDGEAAATAAAKAKVKLRQQMTNSWLMRAAALSGNLELVRWLREQGCAWNEFAFWSAAESGSVELMEWMMAQGCPMGDDGEAYLRAGRNGDFASLRCLHRLGCPWDPAGRTFSTAVCDFLSGDGVEGCSLEVLHWLAEAGCPVDWQEATSHAERRTDVEVQRWVTLAHMAFGFMCGVSRGRGVGGSAHRYAGSSCSVVDRIHGASGSGRGAAGWGRGGAGSAPGAADSASRAVGSARGAAGSAPGPAMVARRSAGVASNAAGPVGAAAGSGRGAAGSGREAAGSGRGGTFLGFRGARGARG